MEIRWSLPAVDDLERICAWIERDHPEASQRVANTIYNGISRLGEFPALGRPSNRVAGWRELIFPPLPYVVVYRVGKEAIEIARIYHGAQNWP